VFEKECTAAAVFMWVVGALSLFLVPQRWVHFVILGASLVVSAVAWLGRARLRTASQSWPTVAGRVEFTAVQQDGQGRTFGPYTLHVAYSYQAAGERYSGFHEQNFRRETDAHAAAAKLRGSTIAVRYDPQSPETSTAHDI
jgi:hypothetical protein